MVGTPNIKINSSMIEEFSSPITSEDSKKSYLYVNADNQVEYKTIKNLIDDINKAGGLDGGGHERGIADFDASVAYDEGDLVIHMNAIFKCVKNTPIDKPFEYADWEMIAGYHKESQFFYHPTEEINSVELKEEVAGKNSFIVNVNNLMLQSNNFYLDEDHKTIVFNEPIAPDTTIEVIVYGNMIVPTNVSNVMIKHFTTVLDNEDEFYLDERILKKEFVTVNIENTVIMESEWELTEDRQGIKLLNPVPVGTRIQVSWFNNISMSIGATFTPSVEEYDEEDLRYNVLSWTNDQHLINPSDVVIYDGATFTPIVNKTGTLTSLSWENNAELENPTTVVIKDGATFTPTVTKEDYTTTIEWSNDVGLENPTTVQLKDGIKYVPTVTKEGLNTTISWSNDQEAENPADVVIEDGATFTPHTTQDLHTATISFTNDKGLENPETIEIYTNYAQRIVESFTATEGQTEFVASHDIYDKCLLSINVGNTELTSAAYSLGEDGKTITLVNGLSEGDLVDIKYFYNLNIGVQGTTYIPTITEIEEGYTLSWENNGDLENPETITIRNVGIVVRGKWSADEAYVKNDYVTYEDDYNQYSYIALSDVPAGTELTDTTLWFENTKVAKYVAAQMVDWGE